MFVAIYKSGNSTFIILTNLIPSQIVYNISTIYYNHITHNTCFIEHIMDQTI